MTADEYLKVVEFLMAGHDPTWLPSMFPPILLVKAPLGSKDAKQNNYSFAIILSGKHLKSSLKMHAE
jgi:hypothetical protein